LRSAVHGMNRSGATKSRGGHRMIVLRLSRD
jgi:hypothetical protein